MAEMSMQQGWIVKKWR